MNNIIRSIYAHDLLLQPTWLDGNDRSAELAAAIHEAGDFELYFGIPESKLFLDMLSIVQPMFYNILDKDGRFIGYIGFHQESSDHELEIYILAPYRKKGHAKEALSAAIMAAFNGNIDGMDKCERIVASVRVENTASHALMKSVGFAENNEIAFCMQVFHEKNNKNDRQLRLVSYYMTKEMFTER